jgi:hypothetical protein
MHDTPCDNKKKSPLFLGGFSLSKRLKNKAFISSSPDFFYIYIPFFYLFFGLIDILGGKIFWKARKYLSLWRFSLIW